MTDMQTVTAEIYYPESDRIPLTDGRPTVETDTHRDLVADLIHALRERFRDDAQVYVTGNLLVHCEEGNPQTCVVPDVLVARGVQDHPRGVYNVWEEGKGPDLVIEVTSKSTKLEDLGYKKALYAQLGVHEYFLFDPLGEWLEPSFIAYRLEDEEFVRLEIADGRVESESTGLTFGVVAGELRVWEPGTGRLLPTPSEESRARVEAEIERAAAEIARAEAERARAEAECDRDAERDARRQAEAQAKTLAEEVGELRQQVAAQSHDRSA